MKILTLIAFLLNVLNPIMGSDYVYNYTIENSVVSSQTIYRKNDDKRYISPKSKYNFTYDDQQRIVKKEVLYWDNQNNSWINDHCLNWTYIPTGYAIEYANWNKGANDYTDIKEKQVVTKLDDGFLSVSIFKRNLEGSNWTLKDNMQTFNPPSIYSYYRKIK